MRESEIFNISIIIINRNNTIWAVKQVGRSRSKEKLEREGKRMRMFSKSRGPQRGTRPSGDLLAISNQGNIHPPWKIIRRGGRTNIHQESLILDELLLIDRLLMNFRAVRKEFL